jgi:hypothetical protein
MVIFLFAVAGAILGALTAKRRNGTRLDIAHYATGYAIAFAILGLFVTLAFLNANT